nr:hypothetical protein [Candidatus Njordarchaeum guaymaensis]
MGKKRQSLQRHPVKLPSAYRYLVLGLLLPIFVFAGMIIGYNYGATIGDFYSAIFGALGSMTGMIVASVVIVKIALFWDKQISRSIKKSRAKRTEGIN